MSNDPIIETPAADAHNVEPTVSASESAPAGEPMPVPVVASAVPAWRGIKSGTWIAAVAAALALAVALSGVSFGAGVFVGQHAGPFGERGPAGAMAANRYDQPWAMPGDALPDRQDGQRMMPGPQGQGVAPQGMPGPGMRGGRRPWGSESGTATPSPFGN